MYSLRNTTNYNIFKCRFPGCNKNIPVASFLAHNDYSIGISYLQKEGIDLNHYLIAIDATCPFCSHANHFRVMDRVREISRQEYDAQSNTVKANSSRIKIVYRVNIQAECTDPTGLETLPHKNVSKKLRKLTPPYLSRGRVSTIPHYF
jgi:hypothetical protein